jgi:hypothetical protein
MFSKAVKRLSNNEAAGTARLKKVIVHKRFILACHNFLIFWSITLIEIELKL